jgi:NAD-dependent SIR2 family protein deacetylase
MSKNIRRGRIGTVLCASCGQKIRRDRAVYMYKDGIKVYYCPDCAKKIHNSKLFKGIPKFARGRAKPTIRRKFSVLHLTETEEDTGIVENAVEESQTPATVTQDEQNTEKKEEEKKTE